MSTLRRYEILLPLRVKNQLMRRWLAAPQPDEGGTLTKARGPMGLDELTSYKWLGIGKGQIRT